MTDLLWEGRPVPARGPRPSLTLERITAAAIAIADVKGLAAISMQHVAAHLGLTKMSLYRYLPGKAELIALMVDQGMGPPPALTAAGWRAGLAQWAQHLLATFLRRPWALEATLGARPVGPNEVAWTDAALALLTETGLRGGERFDALVVLTGHVRMIAQQAAAGARSEHQLTEVLARLLDAPGQDRAARFPALAQTLADTAAGDQDEAFTFGLERILDGLQALIERRAHSC